MSQAYREHPPAQAIAEAVVIAAALLAAVEAAPVPSTTPSRGILRGENAVRPKLWTTLAVIAFAALAGAAIFGSGRESPVDVAVLSAPANAAPSSAAPASPVEPAITVAAPKAPEPERSITDAITAPAATAEHTDQPTPTLKEPRKASRASHDDRRNAPPRVGSTDAYATQTTKTKKATTVAQTQNAPAPAKDPNCNVFLPDNVFMSHHDQFRCFR